MRLAIAARNAEDVIRRLWFSFLPLAVVIMALAACGPSDAPAETPNIAPTQTRAAELAQLATLTAPMATAVATSAPIATPVPATSTATLLAATQARYFAEKGRERIGPPFIFDVTGDGYAEYIYVSNGPDCGSCQTGWVTVFSGNESIFESGGYAVFDSGGYFEPVVTAAAYGGGFIVGDKKVLAGESVANPSGRVSWWFRWNGTHFINTETIEYGADGRIIVVVSPESGSASHFTTPTPTATLVPPTATALPTTTPIPPTAPTAYPTPTPNRVGNDTRPGVYIAQNWQWQGMPMPAGVYHIGETNSAVGFYVNASEDAVFNWFFNNWQPTGYGFNRNLVEPRPGSYSNRFFCRRTPQGISSTDCFRISVLPDARSTGNTPSPYPGYTFVAVHNQAR